MAEVTVNNVVKESKTPAVIGVGVLLGFMAQKVVNKAIGYAGTSGLMGETTATNLKKYVSPAIVTGVGVAINLSSKDELVKNLGAGMAISGPVNIGMQVLWNKNPLSGLDGFLGSLLDDPEDLDGYDDEDDLGDTEDEDDLGDTEDDDDERLKGLGETEPEDGTVTTPIAALPAATDIKLNVAQSEVKQMEGNIGDLLPSKTPGRREVFPEPINFGEDINLL
ncbi:MAG: hypothetical protein II956_16030 [Bacteroidales bacterium]|nr:hypothetical protein [Bacteroidales bacterium]